jgi:hypothetical protein
MASNPPAGAPQLPVLYKNLVPVSTEVHANYGVLPRDTLEIIRNIHAVPLTVDEFIMAQRNFPIVFASGPATVPLCLMGLQEGSNVFIKDDGKWPDFHYVPAYVRRHPFMLVRLRPDSNELSLCFDDTAPEVADNAGDRLFDNGQQTDVTRNIMKFCEEFEQSVIRTQQFIDEINKLGLLIDGEFSIQTPGQEKPSVYRGFRMVSEEKLRELRGDQLRKMEQNGMLGLIHAHLISLSLIREVFAREQIASQRAAA